MASRIGPIAAAVCALALVAGVHVRTQAPFIVFGSNSGVPQPIKATSNALWASLQGGSVTTVPFTVNGPGLAAVSTDGLVVQNTTAATVGAPVQISPRSKWCGTAYNSVSTLSEIDCWIAEVLPVTVAGATTSAFNLSSSIAGGAYANRLSVTSAGAVSAVSSVTAGAYLIGTIGVAPTTSGRSILSSTADKLMQQTDNGGTTGYELNLGTPTLGTCTGGSMVSGSHNFGGEVTGNTSGSCVINFGAPNYTNTPFCWVNDETQLIAARISARSASSITVTGVGSGDAFQFGCSGRIGT